MASVRMERRSTNASFSTSHLPRATPMYMPVSLDQTEFTSSWSSVGEFEYFPRCTLVPSTADGAVPRNTGLSVMVDARIASRFSDTASSICNLSDKVTCWNGLKYVASILNQHCAFLCGFRIVQRKLQSFLRSFRMYIHLLQKKVSALHSVGDDTSSDQDLLFHSLHAVAIFAILSRNLGGRATEQDEVFFAGVVGQVFLQLLKIPFVKHMSIYQIYQLIQLRSGLSVSFLCDTHGTVATQFTGKVTIKATSQHLPDDFGSFASYYFGTSPVLSDLFEQQFKLYTTVRNLCNIYLRVSVCCKPVVTGYSSFLKSIPIELYDWLVWVISVTPYILRRPAGRLRVASIFSAIDMVRSSLAAPDRAATDAQNNATWPTVSSTKAREALCRYIKTRLHALTAVKYPGEIADEESRATVVGGLACAFYMYGTAVDEIKFTFGELAEAGLISPTVEIDKLLSDIPTALAPVKVAGTATCEQNVAHMENTTDSDDEERATLLLAQFVSLAKANQPERVDPYASAPKRRKLL